MILILELIILLILIWTCFWQSSLIIAQYIGAPSIYTSQSVFDKAFGEVGVKSGDLVIDLGCGNAKSLITAARSYGARGLGVEVSPYCYIVSKINVLFSGNSNNIKIVFGNFACVKDQLKNADFVYLYLSNSSLKKMESWLFKNIGQKTKIISLGFIFPNKKPERTIKVVNLGSKSTLRIYSK